MVKKQNEEVVQDTAIEESAGEVRVYEVGFHIDPELSQDDVKQVFKSIKDTCASVGTVVATGAPEKIKLAYTISRMEHAGRHDFSTSSFAWIAYEASIEGHSKVLETVSSDKRIFRFIDLVTTKEEAEHSAEQREIIARTQENQEGVSEAVSEKELDVALGETKA